MTALSCGHLVRSFDFVALQLDLLLPDTIVFGSTCCNLAVDTVWGDGIEDRRLVVVRLLDWIWRLRSLMRVS
jgi:hypothetical protein